MTLLRYLGTGWSYPVRPKEAGTLELAAGPSKVEQSIWIILDTEPGERVMRPTFGCGLRRYLMEPNTVAIRALMQRDVEAALTTWEPRVSLRKVLVEPGSDPALVLIHIDYVHVRDGRPGNLVYPFYLS